jgi:hypothetical protein
MLMNTILLYVYVVWKMKRSDVGPQMELNKMEDSYDVNFSLSADGAYPRIDISNVSIIRVGERLVGPNNQLRPSHFEVAIKREDGSLVNGDSIKFETARQLANGILKILDSVLYEEEE